MIRDAGARRQAPGSEDEPPDEALIERVSRGELGALGVLFDRHSPAVRRVIARLGVQASDVDDVVQATFLDVLDAAVRFDGRASGKAWLLGLAVMHVRRSRRSIARLAARAAAWALEPRRPPTTPEELASLGEEGRRAARAFEALSAKKREVLVLVTFEGLSGEEVATSLGVPVATVWTRLHHARRELMEAVFEEES